MKLSRRSTRGAATMAIALGIALGFIQTPPALAAGGSMNIADAPNARDAAGNGYRIEGNGHVRTGLVFRSDALNTLTSAEQSALRADGVTEVLDLRTAAEISAAPDQLPSSINHVAVSIDDTALVNTTNAAISGGPAKQVALLGNGKAQQLMVQLYRQMITDATDRRQLATALTDIANTNAPIMYHCTAGKDRTGLVSALLLTALGVPRATVSDDYLQSNTDLKASNDAQIAKLEQAGLVTTATAPLLTPILDVDKSYLDASFNQIAQSYGSFDNFLTKGLGLDNTILTKLRQRLIE